MIDLIYKTVIYIINLYSQTIYGKQKKMNGRTIFYPLNFTQYNAVINFMLNFTSGATQGRGLHSRE